jgi:hypothetical protein
MLLSGRWAYVLGDLKPGETAQLKPGEQRDLVHVLHHPDQVVSYGPGAASSSANVMNALQQMMFYKAAGGRSLAGQASSSQEFVDLSDLLELDRAILIGNSSTPAAQLTNAGQPLAGPEDQHWTVYRFIFPVSRAKSSRE